MSIFGAAASKAAEVKDVELNQIQPDGISSLSWSPTADLLAVGSWNNEVRIYEVGQGGQNQGKASYSHEGPVLCTHWSKDGTKVVSGGADKAGRMFDVSTGQSSQIAAHDEPIRCIRWLEVNGQGLVATGSWDKTIKYWDVRSQNPVASVALPERCYAMDVQGPLMVVGTAERHICIINLNSPTTIFKTIPSPLKMQTRAIACFPDSTGYAMVSIEGRTAIQHIDDAKASGNFSFKCHRKDTKADFGKTTTDVYAVNALSFHPLGSFSTAGSDGVINIWDYQSRTRLKTFSDLGGTISATDFSHTGQYLAYAVSYDWSKGYSFNTPNYPNAVKIHTCQEDEVRRRPKK